MSRRVWNLATTVMDLFKRGNIQLSEKGSKPKPGPRGSEPDFKQQYFAPIRTPKEDEQCFLLQKVIDGKLPVLGMKESARQMKQMEVLKSTFVNLVNIDSWEEAKAQLPLFTNEGVLEQFSKLDFSGGTPQTFADFCTRAKSSLDPTIDERISTDHEDIVIKHGENNCHVFVMALPFVELYSGLGFL